MNYIDFAIAVSLFLFFFIALIIVSTNYFSNLSSLTQVSEFRTLAEGFFKLLFETHGMPEDWHLNSNFTPVEIGLMGYVYRIPVLVVEDSNKTRTNDIVDVNITFDNDCQNKTWNDSIRVFDDNLNEITYNTYSEVYCNNQFLRLSNIFWKINITANEKKIFYVYYSDETIMGPNYTCLYYSSSSWMPNDGDNWTESGYNGTWSTAGDSPTWDIGLNTTCLKIGNDCIEVNTSSDGTGRINYNNVVDITSYNHLIIHIRANESTTLDQVRFTCPDWSNAIYNDTNIAISNEWTKIVYDLNNFNVSGSPNLSNCDSFQFQGYDPGRRIWIDGLHFKEGLHKVNAYPEERFDSLSSSKINALENMSYDQVLKTLGDFEFRIEVT